MKFSPETLKYVLDACSNRGKSSVECAPAREFDRSYLAKVTILVVNDTEAEMLSGICVAEEKSAELAAKELMRLGCETVIITLGARGSYIASSGACEWIPAFKVDAVDTTSCR